MKCPKCNHDNKDDAIYCGLCYEVLNRVPVQSQLPRQLQEDFRSKLSAVAGKTAPVFLRELAVAAGYLCVAFYPLLVWSDLKVLSQMGWAGFRILAPWEEGNTTSPLGFCAAPIMMILLYFRAKNFQAGARAVRYLDVAVMAGFAIFGCALLYAGAATSHKTGFFVVLGIVVLVVTPDRNANWK